jgi:hypothetical protein
MNEIPDNVFYVEPPTLAPGLTIHEYRINRPRRRWRVMRWRFTRS